MNGISWRSQVKEGRVFELRSKSTKYPAPCALVIDEKGTGWGSRMFAAVDRFGVIGDGLYARRHNPAIYVNGLRLEQFNSSRVLRRRRDLERFDADDLALIRYGLALDFTGKIHGSYSDIHIPTVVPAEWTIFWIAAYGEDDGRWFDWMDATDDLAKLLHGAWHFESRGGRRDLGYKFGFAWGTRHTGSRLNQIRRFLRTRWGSSLIEQSTRVVRWTEGENVCTAEIRRNCPPLGGRSMTVQSPQGICGIYC